MGDVFATLIIVGHDVPSNIPNVIGFDDLVVE
jgi:hypothetical protein